MRGRGGGIFKKETQKTLWDSRNCPEVDIAKAEDLGRWWTTAASKEVKEEEHKIDFDGMKDRNGVYREKSGWKIF